MRGRDGHRVADPDGGHRQARERAKRSARIVRFEGARSHAMKSLLIVADDLSGAADCAIAFAAAGRKTVVSLDAAASDMGAAVIAADTDTRRLTPAEAAKRTA